MQNEFGNGKTQALHIIGQLISKELRPLEEEISKLETDVSFLADRIAECQVITAEFPCLRKDINDCLEIAEPFGRLMRWRLRLSEFDFEVRYKKGRATSQADACLG